MERRLAAIFAADVAGYSRLIGVDEEGTLARFQAHRRELIDRFGPLPPAATRLLDRMELRILAARWKIDAIHLEDAYLVFKYRDAARIQELARLHGKRLRVVDGRSAYLPLPQEVTDPDSLAALVKVVLLADQVLPYNPPPMAGAAKPWA